MSNKKKYVILFLILTASIFLRVGHLNRPVSKHHEYNVGFFLIPMYIWNGSSAFDYNFVHVCNYNTAADKNITVFGFSEFQKNGMDYYTSFPPLSYMLPYAFFQLFHLDINPLNLQIFNLLIFCCCFILVYKISEQVFKRYKNFELYTCAIFASMPATLWFHGNAYTHHVLYILFFLSSIYYYLNYSKNGGYKFLFYVSIFLGMYTEWAGLFQVFVFFIYEGYLFYKDRKFKATLYLIPLVTIASLGLTIYQLGSYTGYQQFFNYLQNRFSDRSDANNLSGKVLFIPAMIKWQVIGYTGAFVFLIANLVRKSALSALYEAYKRNRKFFAFIIIPGMIHHFVFSNFTTVHDYSVLIDSFWISVCTIIFLFTIKDVRTRNLVFCACILINIGAYFYINRLGKINQNGDTYSMYQDMGNIIQANAAKDETVILDGDAWLYGNCPQLMWYAKRNYIVDIDSSGCKLLNDKNSKKLAVFTIKDNKVVNCRHLLCK